MGHSQLIGKSTFSRIFSSKHSVVMFSVVNSKHAERPVMTG